MQSLQPKALLKVYLRASDQAQKLDAWQVVFLKLSLTLADVLRVHLAFWATSRRAGHRATLDPREGLLTEVFQGRQARKLCASCLSVLLWITGLGKEPLIKRGEPLGPYRGHLLFTKEYRWVTDYCLDGSPLQSSQKASL